MHKKLRYIGISAVVVIAITSLVVAANNPSYAIAIQLFGKNIENPESDAASDLANGKIKCYEINGYGPHLPSVKTDDHFRVCSLGKIINVFGTSDALHDQAHAKAQNKAVKYASEYNSYVVLHAR